MFPSPVGGIVGVLYGLCRRRKQWGGSAVQSLVTKIDDVIITMKTGKMVYNTPILLVFKWKSIVSVVLENQGADMVAVVVSLLSAPFTS